MANISICSNAYRDEDDDYQVLCKETQSGCAYQFSCGISGRCELSYKAEYCPSNPDNQEDESEEIIVTQPEIKLKKNFIQKFLESIKKLF